MGVILRGAGMSAFPRGVGNWISVRLRLGVGVGVGVGVPVAVKICANFRISYMFWASKQVKGAASVGLSRALARRLAASVATSTDDIAGIALLWGRALLFFLCALPMSLAYICVIIGSGVGVCRCTTLPCHGSTKFSSDVVSHG